MGQKRTDKSPCLSKYGGGYITKAQYLTECLCYLVARKNRQELCDQFWNGEAWKRFFIRQVGLANGLLKEYPYEVILDALRDKRCRRLESFGANFILKPVLNEYLGKYQMHKALTVERPTAKPSTDEPTRKPFVYNKNILQRLKEIDESGSN
jgi:hypothetical protein